MLKAKRKRNREIKEVKLVINETGIFFWKKIKTIGQVWESKRETERELEREREKVSVCVCVWERERVRKRKGNKESSWERKADGYTEREKEIKKDLERKRQMDKQKEI